jgi:membrane-bound lytic murein transglycosylase D
MSCNYFATFESRKDVVMNDPDIAAQAALVNSYMNPTMVRVAKYIWYKVRRGETLSGIAARYGVGLAEMREWNRLRNNYIARGQNLKILTFPEVPVYQAPQAATATIPSAGNNVRPDSSLTAGADTLSEKALRDASGTDSNREKLRSKHTTATARTKSAVAAINASTKYYRVQSGDSLWSIAQHYPGLTIDKLKSDNKLSGRSLQKGQMLRIVL